MQYNSAHFEDRDWLRFAQKEKDLLQKIESNRLFAPGRTAKPAAESRQHRRRQI